MDKILSATIAILCISLVIHPASATSVSFYTSRAAFEAQLLSSSTIDFEGIVSNTSYTDYNVGMTDVDFSSTGGAGSLRVVGTNPPGGWSGAPFQSAILATVYSGILTADLTTAGTGFNAAGGWFGSTASALSYDTLTTLTLYGVSGVLDTQVVEWNSMSQGNAESFFGWIVDGDEITHITHKLTGNSYGWEAVDNFTYGYAIPEPATLSLLALVILLQRKRK